MKKLLLLLSATAFLGACQTMHGVGEDISNIEMPSMSKLEPASSTASINPNAADKDNAQGEYIEPAAPAATEKEVDIKRDFPSYHTSPRFDQEPENK